MTDPALDLIESAFSDGNCLRLVLSDPLRKRNGQLAKVDVRPVTIRERPMWQFAFHAAERVTHENLTARAAGRRARELLSQSFDQAVLFAADANHTINRRRDGAFQIRSSPPTLSAAPTGHNRAKAHLIPEGEPCPFLIEIGVMTPTGQVRRAMQHKFRQINRFLELVDDIVPSLPVDRELHVVDFGCGKSYLTFALHYLLTELRGRRVRLVGLDRKADVIEHCTDLARRLACAGLEFRVGDLASYESPDPLDLAVSLHACDTATDLAIAQAVRQSARVILAVPCCQHEISPQLKHEVLAPLVRHGILRERFAAIATDALRALVLEICGYGTQVVEFIDLEHTAKNVLLRAVRRERPDVALRESRLRELRELKNLLGIEAFALDRALAHELHPGM